MKTTVRLFALMVAVGFPFGYSTSEAARPTNVEIEFELGFTGPNSAEGTFVATGFVNDDGLAIETFVIHGPHADGTKVFQGQDGDIELLFTVRITFTSETTAVADGRFVVMGGTGAYTNLKGVGTTHVELDFVAGTIVCVYEGTLWFRP